VFRANYNVSRFLTDALTQGGVISAIDGESITSFCALNIPIAISHCSFYVKVMDDRHTQNMSIGMHSASFKHWYASCGNYDELM